MKKIEDYTIGEVIKNCKEASCQNCPFCYRKETNYITCLFNDNVNEWARNIDKCNGVKEYKQNQKEELLMEFDKLDFIPTNVCADEKAAEEWRKRLSEFLDYILEEKEN